MFIATLIASDSLNAGDISGAADRLAAAGLRNAGSRWVEPGVACDLRFEGDMTAGRAALEGALPGVDVVVQPEPGRRKMLLHKLHLVHDRKLKVPNPELSREHHLVDFRARRRHRAEQAEQGCCYEDQDTFHVASQEKDAGHQAGLVMAERHNGPWARPSSKAGTAQHR